MDLLADIEGDAKELLHMAKLDPDEAHSMVACQAILSLRKLGLEPIASDETIKSLSGDNIYKCNFFDVVDWDGSYKKRGG